MLVAEVDESVFNYPGLYLAFLASLTPSGIGGMDPNGDPHLGNIYHSNHAFATGLRCRLATVRRRMIHRPPANRDTSRGRFAK